MKQSGSIVRDIGIYVLLLALSLLCFWEVLALDFFSDDFYVMHRLTIDKVFWAPGFFRPLSDLTLLFSYYTSGYNALGYRLLHVILHAFNAFMLYKTFRKVFELKPEQNEVAALIAAVLFVTYPFHTEPIIWIVGRASLVANTFGILSLYCFFSHYNYKKRIALSCACYFIGLASYESILVIPGIVFFAVWYYKHLKEAFLTMIPYAVTLGLHIIVRLWASGVFAGAYGKDMFGEDQTNYAVKFIKSFGRLFVPPLHNSIWLTVLFIVAFAIIILSFYIVHKYRRRQFHFYVLLWLFLLVAHIVPTMFGVDTHTSDGDRLLYFPSYFLAPIIGYGICLFIKPRALQIALTAFLGLVSVLLIKWNNQNWIRADEAINDVFSNIRNNCCKPVYFINMPDAIEGGFVFRNGFNEAMEIKQVKGDVRVLNYLKNKEAILLPDTIRPEKSPAGIRISPSVTITENSFRIDSLAQGQVVTKDVKRDPGSVILFWNRNKVVTLLP